MAPAPDIILRSSVPWPALVLAAGLGTRLAPLSAVRAKAALPVAGRPLIVRILEQLRRAGIRQVVINLHHRPETITAVIGDGAAFGLQVRYSWEPRLLGSGGGPARALPLLAADRFFIVNGDTLADIDLAALATAHRASGARATLAVAPADLVKYGALVADASGQLLGWLPRRAPTAMLPASGRLWHFVGVQAVDASAFAAVDAAAPSEVIREIYPRLVASQPGAVRVFPAAGAFFDIGTPLDYLETVRRVARAEGGVLDCGEGTVVHPTARLDDSILWDDVRVGARAHLTRCIVADGVVIPAGARYDRLVITRHATAPF